MTDRHPIRRLLAWICSADTMARVVDPTLADMRWESGRPTWRGCLSLARALSMHAITSTPNALVHTWSDDERAIPKAAAIVTAVALCAAVPLMAPPLLNVVSRGQTFFGVAVLLPSLVPQALGLTLPAAILLAFPLAFRRQQLSSRLARRGMTLTIGFTVVTFAVIAWMVPVANQAFRVAVSGNARLEPGPMEMTLGDLREKIDVLKLTPGGRVWARRVEYLYQVRLALAAAPLSLGLFALAITASPKTRRRPWLTGISAMAFYVFTMFAISEVAAGLLVRAPALPPILFAWAPNLLFVLAAGVIHRSRRFQLQPPLPPPRASPAV
jgi:lipopolysaccharide export system permease LptF/LptG-like protein